MSWAKVFELWSKIKQEKVCKNSVNISRQAKEGKK
jgi:hypothetical protein